MNKELILCLFLSLLMIFPCGCNGKPSNEAELIEQLLNGKINSEEFQTLAETGGYNTEILLKDLKRIAGVNDIKLKDSDTIEAECYLTEKYSVEMLTPNSPIYVGDNKEEGFEGLGKYRFKITVSDSEPSEEFSQKYKANVIYSLSGSTEFKFVYTNLIETHATEIYIGSDNEFSVENQSVKKEMIKEAIAIAIKR